MSQNVVFHISHCLWWKTWQYKLKIKLDTDRYNIWEGIWRGRVALKRIQDKQIEELVRDPESKREREIQGGRETETPNGWKEMGISGMAIKPLYIAAVPPDKTLRSRQMAENRSQAQSDIHTHSVCHHLRSQLKKAWINKCPLSKTHVHTHNHPGVNQKMNCLN